MADLHLEIVSLDGEIFSGEAKSILLTTTEGEIQLLRGHADLAAPLSTGRAKLVTSSGEEKLAAVSGGFVIADRSGVRVVTTTFEFASDIDVERARAAKEVAEQRLKSAKSDTEIELAKAKLARAISRISVATK
jgi:F-type H+-transporting ATPase subunit epsilon